MKKKAPKPDLDSLWVEYRERFGENPPLLEMEGYGEFEQLILECLEQNKPWESRLPEGAIR